MIRAWLVENLWIGEIFLAVLLLIAFNFFLRKLLSRSKQKGQLKEGDWRAHLDFAILAPARVLLWILLLTFLADLLTRELKLEGIFSFIISPLRNIGAIFCLAWFLLRWKKVFHNAMIERRMKGKPSFDPVSLEVLGKLFTVAVIFISLLIVMQLIGLSIAPLITFGGIGAAALGIASRDVVANFFGGMMLYATRPFTVNDLIEMPEKSIMGTVELIGWYHTSIRDVQKKPIYVPNSVFSTSHLINWSRITHRRIDETIAIRPEDAPKVFSIVEAIRSLFKQCDEIDHHLSVNVFFQSYKQYSLEIVLQAYTLTTRYEEFMELKQKILIGVKEILDKAGAEIAPNAKLEVVGR